MRLYKFQYNGQDRAIVLDNVVSIMRDDWDELKRTQVMMLGGDIIVVNEDFDNVVDALEENNS